jgi:hypothetical protein
MELIVASVASSAVASASGVSTPAVACKTLFDGFTNLIAGTSSVAATSGHTSAMSSAKATSSSATPSGTAAATTAAGATSDGSHVKVVGYVVLGLAAMAARFAFH